MTSQLTKKCKMNILILSTILATVLTNFIICYDQFHEIYDFIFEKKYIMYILIQNRMYDSWTKCIIYMVISMSTMCDCYSTLECEG
jgi:hypothetical protein